MTERLLTNLILFFISYHYPPGDKNSNLILAEEITQTQTQTVIAMTKEEKRESRGFEDDANNVR